jgi:polysaccharide chain length determinant protein (PEP-CTERM system associated)
MPENVKAKDPEGFDLQHYLGIVRRRHLHFLIPLFLGWLAVWGSSWILPARYESSTLILVEQPTMSKDYVVPNVNEDLQGRMQSLTQQILSRTRLLHIVDELNLYAKDRRRLGPDEIVERMRKDIQIELVQDAQKQHVTAFRIHYSAHDPSIAQQVTSKLTNLFINENLEERQQQSEGTTKFLEDQMETARQSLETQEAKIREFKGQHVTELPSQLGSNIQILSGLQSQLQTENGALNAAKQQQVYLETLLREYRTLRGSSESPEGAPMDLSSIEQELDKLEKQLADLNSRYKEQMPEVRKLKHQIAAMEKMRDQHLADLKTKGSSTQPDVNPAAPAEDSTDVRNQPQVLQLQSQLQSNQAEIRNREQMIAALKSKINDYQARLNQEPVREQELADLTRGYEQSKASYDDLQKKKNQSVMATNMELLQQGEHFRILDPPSLPIKPSFPDRLKFCGIGLLVGLALGVGVAGAFEMMDDRVYNEQELKGMLPVSVLSEIPIINAPANERAEQKKVWLGWATAAVVFATILAGSTISYLVG